MISLSQVQTTAKTAIKASTFFADKDVLEDYGLVEKDFAAALRDHGVCVVVTPVVEGDTVDKTKGDADLNVSFMVRVSTNPKQLSKLNATFNCYTVVSKVVAAMLDWKSEDGREYFTLEGRALELGKKDPGMWEYGLIFRKLVLME